MELLRLLEQQQGQLWNQVQKLTTLMIESRDCSPELLSGWTERNISLWDISDTNQKPGCERILMALCVNKAGDWTKVGYLVFSDKEVSFAGLELVQTNGKTKDSEINLSKTHYEIKDITGKQLCTLIHAISQSPFEVRWYRRDDMIRTILETAQMYGKQKDRFTTTPTTTATTPPPINVPATSGTQQFAFSPLPSQASLPQQTPSGGTLPASSADTNPDHPDSPPLTSTQQH